MKTILRIALMAFVLSAFTGSAQTVIYSENFASGINPSWQNSGTSNGLSNQWAKWKYTHSGSHGAYGTPTDFINSPTKTNGFIIFDSDSLDNGGVAGSFGLGPAPAPQTVALTTSAISVAGTPYCMLSFYQYFRNFQSTTIVGISTDSLNWKLDTINTLVAVNASTASNSQIGIDLSPIILQGGPANKVYLKFIMNANYYFWMIDDISITTLPANNLAALSVSGQAGNNGLGLFYASIPVSEADSLQARSFFGNQGVMTQTHVSAGFKMLKNGTQVGSTVSSSVLAQLPYNVDSSGVAEFQTQGLGQYNIAVNINSDSTDASPANNRDTLSFAVTDSVYSINTTTVPNSASYFLLRSNTGQSFRFGTLFQLDHTDTVTSVTSAFAGGAFGTHAGAVVQATIYPVTVNGTSISYNTATVKTYPRTLAASDITGTAATNVVPVTMKIDNSSGNAVLAPGTYWVAIGALSTPDSNVLISSTKYQTNGFPVMEQNGTLFYSSATDAAYCNLNFGHAASLLYANWTRNPATTPVSTGQNITFTGLSNGGASTTTYSWTMTGLTSGLTYSGSGRVITQAFSTADSFYVCLTVTDGAYSAGYCNWVRVTGGTTTTATPTTIQSCYSGVANSITPVPHTTPGFSPSDSAFPCIPRGVAVADTIYFTNYTTLSFAGTTINVNSLTFDSIYLPAGLCWSTNKANNTFSTGENGVIYISGTTYDSVGQYKLRTIVNLNTSAVNMININAESSLGLIYRVRVICPSASCPTIDNSSADSALAFIGYPSCTQVVTVQNCNGGTVSITPHAGTVAGFSPADSLLPCISRGVAVSDTIYFTNYTTLTISGILVTVNSLKFDSIYLPTGLCWSTNSATNTFSGGQNGVIYISGTTYDSAGQYKLRMIVTANTNLVTLSHINAEQYLGVRYRLRIICPSSACPAMDNSRADSALSFVPYLSCSPLSLSASITSSGNDTICPGSSVTLTANAGSGYTYRWSNAAHSATRSITVSTAGFYTVTVYSGTDSAVATPVHVVSGINPTATITPGSATTFCTGGYVQLTASGGTSYTWSTGSHLTAISASQAGTYTVRVYNSYGCFDSVSQIVTVNSGPTMTLGPINANLCQGQSVTLTASGAVTYVWSSGGSGSAITVTPSASGTYSVTGTGGNGCTASRSAYVSVAAMPASQSIIGNPSITPFQSYPYLVNATSGITYTWSATGGAIQSGQGTNSVNVIWGSTGPYSITLIQSNSAGCADTTTLLVVNSSCSLSIGITTVAGATICTGDTVLLIAQAQAGSTFRWIRNGVILTGQTRDTLDITSSGTYQVEATSGACTMVSNSNVFLFGQQPQVPVITASGNIGSCFSPNIVLTATGGYQSYVWNTGSVTDSIHTASSGSYTVTVTGSGGCKAVSLPYSLNLSFIPQFQICLVSVDSATGRNEVVWNKPSLVGVDSFFVFKETNQFNVFSRIGGVGAHDLSTLIDPNSNPQQQADRYTIAVLDTCGNVSLQSTPHKTIHLTINSGLGGVWNLIWNAYEGFTFPSYNIYRGTSSGALQFLASISSGNTSYTDLTPPSNVTYYQVEAVNPIGCNPTRSSGYNSSRSNIIQANNTGINTAVQDPINVYPNPSTGVFYFTGVKTGNTIEIYNMMGQIILSLSADKESYPVSLGNQAKGVYSYRVSDHNAIIQQGRIILE